MGRVIIMNNADNDSSILLDYILKYSFDEILVTDAVGTVINISTKTETMFNVYSKDVINKNIYTLEQQGLFAPSVITKVLETKKQTITQQETAQNRKIIISGYPVFDENQKLIKAISFSRDITEFEYLKKENSQIASVIQETKQRLNELEEQMSFYLSNNKNKKMNQIYKILSRVKNLDVIVLLKGESGVGK